MPNFDDTASLMAYINTAVEYATELTADSIVDMVKDYIIDALYDAYDPAEYERTYEFLDSVVHTTPVKIRGGWTVQIKFDTDKIHPYYRGELSSLPEHRSFVKRQRDVSDLIPLWMEEGNGNNEFFQFKGIHSMEYVSEKKLADILAKMKEHFVSLGISATANI